jgi:hypothetical protein
LITAGYYLDQFELKNQPENFSFPNKKKKFLKRKKKEKKGISCMMGE